MVAARRSSMAILTHVEFSPDGQQLAAVHWSGTVHVWDLSHGYPQVTAETRLDVGGLLPPVRWARVGDENTIVYAVELANGVQTQLKQWNPATGRHADIARVQGQARARDGFLVRSGKLVLHLEGNTSGFFQVELASGKVGRAKIGGNRLLDISPDGAYYAVESAGISVITTGSSMPIRDKDGAEAARFSDDGSILLLRAFTGPAHGDGRHFVRAYEPSTGNRLWAIETGHFGEWSRGAAVDLLRLTPDGKQLVVVGYSNIELFDVATGRRAQTIQLRLRESSQSPWCRWWSRSPWQALGLAAHHDWISVRDALSADGRLHARGTRAQPLTVTDLTTGKRQILAKQTGRWIHFAVFVAGFATWGLAWGMVCRNGRRDELSSAWTIMILSGIFLILRGAAIAFRPLEEPADSHVWFSSLPCIGIGVYSIAEGGRRDLRRIIRVVVLQFIGVLFCDPWLCVSAVALLLVRFSPGAADGSSPEPDQGRQNTRRSSVTGRRS